MDDAKKIFKLIEQCEDYVREIKSLREELARKHARISELEKQLLAESPIVQPNLSPNTKQVLKHVAEDVRDTFTRSTLINELKMSNIDAQHQIDTLMRLRLIIVTRPEVKIPGRIPMPAFYALNEQGRSCYITLRDTSRL